MVRAALIFFLLGVTPCFAFDAGDLDKTVRAACGDCIDGVSVLDPADKTKWQLQFKAGATDQQKADAQTAMDAIDPAAVDAAKAAADQAETSRKATLNSDAAVQALANRLKTMSASDIDAWFTANVTTAAQAIAVEKALVKLLALELRQQ